MTGNEIWIDVLTNKCMHREYCSSIFYNWWHHLYNQPLVILKPEITLIWLFLSSKINLKCTSNFMLITSFWAHKNNSKIAHECFKICTHKDITTNRPKNKNLRKLHLVHQLVQKGTWYLFYTLEKFYHIIPEEQRFFLPFEQVLN